MDESHWMGSMKSKVTKVGNQDEKEDRISNWISLTNLCFDESLVLNPERCDGASYGFHNFVNRVLFFTHPAKYWQVLYSLKFWVSSAIMCNVREIELNLSVTFKLSCQTASTLPKHLRFSNLTRISISRFFILNYLNLLTA